MKIIKKIFIISCFFILLLSNFITIYGVEDVQIKITPNTKEVTKSDIILIIELSSTKMFDMSSTQAVQILIGESSATNNWIDLGSGKNGVALKKTYNYIVKENSNVTVRVVSWTKEDRTDLIELANQKIQISNINKSDSITNKVDSNISNNRVSLNVVSIENSAVNTNIISNINTNTNVSSNNTTIENITTQTVENTINDNTVSNKILPQVGAENIAIGSIIVLIISCIYILNKR